MSNFSAKMPLILVFIILSAFFIGDYIPVDIQRGFFTFSLIVKEFLVFLLPFIIFALLFGSIIHLGGEKGTLKFIILLLICVCSSNFIATWVAFGSGSFALSKLHSISPFSATTNELTPLFNFSLPSIIKNDVALFAALIAGLVLPHFSRNIRKTADKLSNYATTFLKKIFIPIVPLFILGFVLKLQFDGVLEQVLKNYVLVFAVILCTQIIYVLGLFGIGSKFNVSKWSQRIKNTLPPFLTGFSTMSSAAALPLTLIAAEKNTNNPTLSRVVVPSTVNIHLIGDCLAIPILALAILNSFGMPLPSLEEYLTFTLFFVVAKFAVAAVPAGGIIVMIPVLEKYLGFNSEMISLITALYIMLDSVITSMNVAGNNAFVVLFDKITRIFLRHKN